LQELQELETAEVKRELTSLVIEVLRRIERENPELLELILSSSKKQNNHSGRKKTKHGSEELTRL